MSASGTVAIIHARGGSKRIPLKNLVVLAGQPLLAYSVRLCQQLSWVDRIIVSTDHDDIAAMALGLGAEVPFRRPPALSEDVASELVTEHALKFLMESSNTQPEFALTLTPATPMTRPETVDKAYQQIRGNPAWDGVTAVRPTAEHPEWMLNMDAKTGEVTTLLGNSLDGEYNVSQNLRKHFYPTGAFWINRVAPFLQAPSLYGKRWGAVLLSKDETVDIDWPDDLRRAESLMANHPLRKSN